MTITFRKIIFASLVFSAFMSTLANADNRKFQIDVLVFSQQTATTEIIDAPNPLVSWPKGLINPGQKNTELNNTASSTLQDAAKILGRKSQYSVLSHNSWNQTIGSEQRGKPVRIRGKGVDGFVQLKRGHNLHLIIGMEFPNEFAENTFTIAEQRRILLKQKHYFDHPRFGVIVNVSPL